MENQNSDQHQRFSGTIKLFGTPSFERFQGASAAVIGIGGVGSWAAEGLARSGVGEITLVDLDEICINNTNRQLHTLNSTVGMLKAQAMAARISDINPSCKVTSRADFLTADTVGEILGSQNFDVVLDAIDSVAHKAVLIAECLRRNTPLVTAGGAGGRLRPDRIRVSGLHLSQGDPLLREVRRALRKAHGLANSDLSPVRAVYSMEPIFLGAGSPSQGPKVRNGRLDCTTGYGTAVQVTASLGFFLCAEALSLLQVPQSTQSVLVLPSD